MKPTRWTPAFHYQFRDFLLGFAPFYAVIFAIVAASLIFTRYYGGDVTFSGFSIASAICLLVFGIVSPRPNLRLCIQLGVSRRTAFCTLLLALFLTCALLAAAGEALFAVGQAAGGTSPNLFLTDLYQLIYVGTEVRAMPFSRHMLSLSFNLSLMLAMFAGGMFLTFLFWRLSKGWTIAAAIAIPVLLNGIPALCYHLSRRFPAAGRLFAALADALLSSVWCAIALFLLSAVLFTALSWLLVCRANIRAPKDS